ncbi:DUF4296 domain-containing protein [uncultured Bacteroides sp.]|uniref:DUF4296 domain-containing protein n=1 Tax=uncultured Bacteroides sp. TaxID=162156 RepID=UPI002AABEF1A|nr:DUF4296 domain-containing protein [uncultured Bacteroides sp.]
MNKNKLNKYFIGFVVAFCIGFSACKKKMPDDVLSKGDMEDVLVDYHIAKAMGDNLLPEERYKQALYLKYVFEKNGTTEEAFDHSLEWYSRNTEDFAKIYEKVNKRLNSKKEDIKNLIAAGGDDEQQQSETGDTVNVWHRQKIYKLTKAAATNKFYFTIYPDSNYKERDIILWSIRSTFTSAKEHPQDAVMSLNIKYVNDSIISDTRNIDRSGTYNIRIQNDSEFKIREIKGFVYYNQLSHYPQDALIVDKIMLTRYHIKKGSSITKTPPANRADSLKKDSVKKREEMHKIEHVGNDSMNRNNQIISGPRRRSVKNRSNDIRVLHNQEIQKPQGIRK